MASKCITISEALNVGDGNQGCVQQSYSDYSIFPTPILMLYKGIISSQYTSIS